MYLIDSWVWVEYFSRPSKEVVDIINGKEMNYTSIISLTEVVTSITRNISVTEGRLAATKLMGVSHILPITSTIAIRAGHYNKSEFPGGIADRIIYATAEAHGLTICTGDLDFKNVPGVLFLGE